MRTTRLVVACAGVAALILFSFKALRFGAADTIVRDASVEMSTWLASGTQPAEQTWGWTRERVERAERWSPGSPNVHELLGLLDARRTQAPESLGRSVDRFKRALELRPTSPHDWANIAATEYRIGHTGSLFERAVVAAAQLGPFEPAIQRAVADYGLAVWNEVRPATREAVGRLVANGMRRDPKEMLQIAERRGRLGVACAYLGRTSRTDPKWVQLCQSTGAT